jgi:hypothetical protein
MEKGVKMKESDQILRDPKITIFINIHNENPGLRMYRENKEPHKTPKCEKSKHCRD